MVEGVVESRFDFGDDYGEASGKVDKIRVGNRGVVDLEALIKTVDVGRGQEAGFIMRVSKNSREEGGG